jgi:uncharacterized spore protein YtfJ
MEKDIESLITSTISNLKEILDISSIIGNPIYIGNDIVIIPVCKMLMGLISGGSDAGKDKLRKAKIDNYAGASGTGISYTPIGAIVVIGNAVKYIPLGKDIPYYNITQSIEKIVGIIIDKMENQNDKT